MTISANNPSLKNTGRKPKKSLTARQVIILRWTTMALLLPAFAGGLPVFFPAFFLVAVVNLVAYRSLDKAQQKIVDDKIGVSNSRMDSGASAGSRTTFVDPNSGTSVGLASCGVMPSSGSSAATWSAYHASQDRRFHH